MTNYLLQNKDVIYEVLTKQLQGTGLFKYGAWDWAGGVVSKHDHLVSKTKDAMQIASGTAGTVGGVILADGSAVACGPTLGIGCLGVPAGVALSKFSVDHTADGIKKWNTPYDSDLGKKVKKSFNTPIYDNNPATDIIINVGENVALAGAGKVVGVGLNAAENGIKKFFKTETKVLEKTAKQELKLAEEAAINKPPVTSEKLVTPKPNAKAKPNASEGKVDKEIKSINKIGEINRSPESIQFHKNNNQAHLAGLEKKAEQQLLAEINKFKTPNQAAKTATMIGAYDAKTGMTAVGKSNVEINANSLHKTTVNYIENKLGVKIGEFTNFCKNKAGTCAEVSAADQLIRKGANPANIKFTEALRPQSVLKNKEKIKVGTCDNCNVAWPKVNK